jgi:hypothetical protein
MLFLLLLLSTSLHEVDSSLYMPQYANTEIMPALQKIQGAPKTSAYHLRQGVLMREKHLREVYRHAGFHEVATRLSNTSKSKQEDAKLALSRLVDIAKDGLWPGDSLSTIVNPAGTGGTELPEFHDVRSKICLGKTEPSFR